jgi:hypothetical protein
MKIGREPRHSLMVTIPRKICETLQIGKGTILYFKLEGNGFVVSKEAGTLEDNTGLDKTEPVEPAKEEHNTIRDERLLASLENW